MTYTELFKKLNHPPFVVRQLQRLVVEIARRPRLPLERMDKIAGRVSRRLNRFSKKRWVGDVVSATWMWISAPARIERSLLLVSRCFREAFPEYAFGPKRGAPDA